MDENNPLTYNNEGYTFYQKKDSIHFNFSFIYDNKNKLDTLTLINFGYKNNGESFLSILNLYEDKYGKFSKKQITEEEITYKYYGIKRIFWDDKNRYNYSINRKKIHACDNPFLCITIKCNNFCKDEYGYHIQNTNLQTGDLESFNVELEEKGNELSKFVLSTYYKVVGSKYIELTYRDYFVIGKDRKKYDYTKSINYLSEEHPNEITIKYTQFQNKAKKDTLNINEQKSKNKLDI